jgi:hypothetical protein
MVPTVIQSFILLATLLGPQESSSFLLQRPSFSYPSQQPSPSVGALSPTSSARTLSSSSSCGIVRLNMAKASNNKQAELKRKLEQAKLQKLETTTATSADNRAEAAALSDRQLKERNDRLRFAELLRKEAANVLNDYSSDGYLNKQQEEEEITAARKCFAGG